MHNQSVDITNNQAIIDDIINRLFVRYGQTDYRLAFWCIGHFINSIDEKVNEKEQKKIRGILATGSTIEEAQSSINLSLNLRSICTNNNDLKEYALNLTKSYVVIYTTKDFYNKQLAGNSKPFVDRVAPQHASTSEHQSHVERYVDPATVKAKAESMESDIESSQSSLRRRHVPENIKSEGASSQTFVEKYADHKKDKPEKGCLETVRAATGGYCSIQ